MSKKEDTSKTKELFLDLTMAGEDTKLLNEIKEAEKKIESKQSNTSNQADSFEQSLQKVSRSNIQKDVDNTLTIDLDLIKDAEKNLENEQVLRAKEREQNERALKKSDTLFNLDLSSKTPTETTFLTPNDLTSAENNKNEENGNTGASLEEIQPFNFDTDAASTQANISASNNDEHEQLLNKTGTFMFNLSDSNVANQGIELSSQNQTTSNFLDLDKEIAREEIKSKTRQGRREQLTSEQQSTALSSEEAETIQSEQSILPEVEIMPKTDESQNIETSPKETVVEKVEIEPKKEPIRVDKTTVCSEVKELCQEEHNLGHQGQISNYEDSFSTNTNSSETIQQEVTSKKRNKEIFDFETANTIESETLFESIDEMLTNDGNVVTSVNNDEAFQGETSTLLEGESDELQTLINKVEAFTFEQEEQSSVINDNQKMEKQVFNSAVRHSGIDTNVDNKVSEYEPVSILEELEKEFDEADVQIVEPGEEQLDFVEEEQADDSLNTLLDRLAKMKDVEVENFITPESSTKEISEQAHATKNADLIDATNGEMDNAPNTQTQETRENKTGENINRELHLKNDEQQLHGLLPQDDLNIMLEEENAELTQLSEIVDELETAVHETHTQNANQENTQEDIQLAENIQKQDKDNKSEIISEFANEVSHAEKAIKEVNERIENKPFDDSLGTIEEIVHEVSEFGKAVKNKQLGKSQELIKHMFDDATADINAETRSDSDGLINYYEDPQLIKEGIGVAPVEEMPNSKVYTDNAEQANKELKVPPIPVAINEIKFKKAPKTDDIGTESKNELSEDSQPVIQVDAEDLDSQEVAEQNLKQAMTNAMIDARIEETKLKQSMKKISISEELANRPKLKRNALEIDLNAEVNILDLPKIKYIDDKINEKATTSSVDNVDLKTMQSDLTKTVQSILDNSQPEKKAIDETIENKQEIENVHAMKTAKVDVSEIDMCENTNEILYTDDQSAPNLDEKTIVESLVIPSKEAIGETVTPSVAATNSDNFNSQTNEVIPSEESNSLNEELTVTKETMVKTGELPELVNEVNSEQSAAEVAIEDTKNDLSETDYDDFEDTKEFILESNTKTLEDNDESKEIPDNKNFQVDMDENDIQNELPSRKQRMNEKKKNIFGVFGKKNK